MGLEMCFDRVEVFWFAQGHRVVWRRRRQIVPRCTVMRLDVLAVRNVSSTDRDALPADTLKLRTFVNQYHVREIRSRLRTF
jgi:hypothetical protein